jgi:hypothetical protein
MTETPPTAHPEQHEDRDLNLRAILGFGVGLVVLTIVVQFLLAWFFFVLLYREQNAKRSSFPLSAPERVELPQTTFGSPVTGQLPNSPRLEGLDLASPAQVMYARDEEELKSYGKPGAVHIPIEQAMRLVAEEWKPKGHEPAPVRYDAGIPGTGGGSNSGRALSEGKR